MKDPVTISRVELDALVKRVTNQAEELRNKQGIIAYYKAKLEALNTIWCTGGCVPGRMTLEQVQDAEREVVRMRTYINNAIFRERCKDDSKYLYRWRARWDRWRWLREVIYQFRKRLSTYGLFTSLEHLKWTRGKF